MTIDFNTIKATYEQAEEDSARRAANRKTVLFSLSDIREDVSDIMDAMATDHLNMSAVTATLKQVDPIKYGKLNISNVRSAILSGKVFTHEDGPSGKEVVRIIKKFE